MTELTTPVARPLDNRADLTEASRILAEALQDEPGFSSVVPDPDQRRDVMHTLLSQLARDAFAFGNVWVARIGQEIAGTAIWYAPGDYPMGTWRSMRMLPAMIGLVRSIGTRTLQSLSEMDTNAKAHFPEQPCWYLSALGVAPGHQGKGVGSCLMRATLEEIDRQGGAAYLETGEERNVRFYERLGFEVRESAIHIAPPPGPTHWTMWREPR